MGYSQVKMCDSFRWTVKGLIHMYTCIHSPSNSPPLQAAKKHWAEFHVLYSRSFLVIHFKYSGVYIFIPNSLTIPSSILHLAAISLFSNSVSLLLFYKFIWRNIIWKVKVKVAQLCPTLCDPIDYTVHGILQARILEWVALPISSGSSQSRNRTQVSDIAGGFFTS